MAFKKLDRCTVFVECEKAASKCAQPFSGTRLTQVENLLAQVLRPYEERKRRSNICDDGRDRFNPFRKIRLKAFQLKQKFFDALFQKFTLRLKTFKPYQIVCLRMEYDVEETDTIEAIYPAKI